MKNKIKKFIKEIHWTTKLVWGVGLAWILITVLAILIFPPGIAFTNLKVVSGEVVSKGILNGSYVKSEKTGVPCSKGCQEFENTQLCGEGYCYRQYRITEPLPGSYGIRTWTGEIIGVVGEDFKIGEHVKVAVDGVNVKEKGGWILWDAQVRIFYDRYLGWNLFLLHPFEGMGTGYEYLVFVVLIPIFWGIQIAGFIAYYTIQERMIFKLLSGMLGLIFITPLPFVFLEYNGQLWFFILPFVGLVYVGLITANLTLRGEDIARIKLR